MTYCAAIYLIVAFINYGLVSRYHPERDFIAWLFGFALWPFWWVILVICFICERIISFFNAYANLCSKGRS